MRKLIRKLLKRAFFCIGFLALLALALWLLRGPLFGGLVKRKITAALSDALGGRYEIGDLGGNWITGIQVHGLRTVESPAEGALERLDATRVVADYDLLGLLGDDPLSAIDALRVEGAMVDLDPGRLREDALSDGSAPDGFSSSLPSVLDVEGDLRVATDAGRAILHGVHIVVADGEPLSLDVREAELPARFDVRGPLAGQVERIGEDTYRWTSEAVLGGVRVREATFALTGHVQARVELAGGTVDVTAAKELVSFVITRLDLAHLPAWLRDLLPEGAPTAGHARGTAALDLSDLPATVFDLQGSGLRIRDEAAFEVAVEGAWDGKQTIALESLQAASLDARVSLRRATLDLRLPWLVHKVDEVVADVASLKALVPDLPRDLALTLRAKSTSPRVIEIERLGATSGADHLDVRGTLKLPADPNAWRDVEIECSFEGEVSNLDPLEVASEGRLGLKGTATGRVTRPELHIDVEGRAARIEGYEVERGALDGRVTAHGVEDGSVHVEGPFGVLRGTGSARFTPLALDLSDVVLDVADVRRLGERLAPEGPAIEGAVVATGRLTLDMERLSVTGRLSGQGIRVDGEDLGRLDATVRSDGRRIHVDALDVEGPWGCAQAIGHLEPYEGVGEIGGLLLRTEDVTASLTHALPVAWGADGIVFDGLVADVAGTYVALDAAVDPDRGSARISRLRVRSNDTIIELRQAQDISWRGATIDLQDVQVGVGADTRIGVSARLDLEKDTVVVTNGEARGAFGEVLLNAPLRLVLEADTVRVEDLDFTHDGMRATASGILHAADRRATIDSLAVTRGDVDGRLLRPVEVTFRDAGIAMRGISAEVLGATVDGALTWRDEPEADLEFEGLALSRFVDGPTGTFKGWVRLGEGMLTAQAGAEDLAIDPWTGGVEVILRQDAEGPLRLERIRVHGPHGGSLAGRAVLPYRATGEGITYLEGVEPTFSLEGTIGGLDALTEVADGPIRVQAHGEAGRIEADVRVADIALCDEGSLCDDGIIHVRITPESATARISLASDEFAAVRGDVALDRGFDWTRPEEVRAILEHAQVEGSISAVVRSWKPLAAVAPGLDRLEGAIGAEMSVRGPLRDPQIDGVLTLQDFSIKMETDLAPFERVNARLVWKDREIRVERFEAQMGYAPVQVGGVIRTPFGETPFFDLTVHGRNTQLLRTDWTRMRIDVDARLIGPIDALRLEGSGVIVEGTFSEPVSLAGAGGVADDSELVLFEIKEWPFSDMTFDLDIKADNSLRIRNNVLRANLSLEGSLRGTGLRPEPVGRASFENADIFLPLSTLRHGTGEVIFLPDLPFRPRIQATASTRTKGYEMGVQLAGTLPDVNLYVFTEPRLDDEDAILMLTTGSTSAELADGGILGKGLSAALSVFGGSLFTAQGDDGEPGGKAFFERFQFTTDWRGSDIARIDGEIELTERFYLHLEADRFDATNLGLIWRFRLR